MCHVSAADAASESHPHLSHWVDAWPFRQHLHHLAESSRLPWRAVAACAELDAGAIRLLARCRPRRGRLPAGQAAALLALTPHDLAVACAQRANLGHARVLAQTLLAAGAHPDELARAVRLPRGSFDALVHGRPVRLRRRTELLLRAALEARGLECPRTQATALPQAA